MKKIVALGVALIAWAVPLTAQTVNTIVPGTTGLLEPYGVAVESDEFIYISDGANHRLVRYQISTGESTTLAGRAGAAGSANGTATQARFFDPKGVLLARGGLVVADAGNHAIRFIDLVNKTVSTLAGSPGNPGGVDGPALNARFRSPRGLAADAAGNIYISDLTSRTIRKLDINNVVTTVVAAGLRGPAGLAVADNGRIFVADRLGHSIKVIETDGTVNHVAGLGSAGAIDDPDPSIAAFNLPEGLLWLGDSFGLLVSDSQNHSLRRVFFDAGANRWNVQIYAGRLEAPGNADGAPAAARFNNPMGLATYSTGFLVVDEQGASVRQVLISPQPPKILTPRIGNIEITLDPTTGQEITRLFPVTDSIFNNEVIIGVLGEQNVSHRYTVGPGRTNIIQADPLPNPTTDSATAPDYVDGGPPSSLPNSIGSPLPILAVKVMSTAPGRTSSSLVQSIFRFQVAAPVLDISSTPGSLTFKCATTNAAVYYTMDGTDPTEGPGAGNPSSRGPVVNGEKLPLNVKSEISFRARGFRANFQASRITAIDLSPTNYVPNRISLGYVGGEASSDFVAAGGQRFFAPITLTVLPNQKMYGLQFNLTVTNATPASPGGDYKPSFSTLLMEDKGTLGFLPIDPKTFVRRDPQVETQIVETTTFTNVILLTNFVSIFSNLVTTNISENLLAVGWLERRGRTNLYNTINQDLIKFSLPHDTLFDSKNGKVVAGGFSFEVPAAAAAGDTYRVAVGRPSANADGVGEDVFIEAPDGTDPLVPVKAVRTLTIGTRRYLVGDVSPFRWFNAGDFGDTNILNNDLEQLHQTMVYALNPPPVGSDMFDALDSCCVDTNGLDVASASEFSDGNEALINTIGFGDGELTMADMYVTFRRSLDPNLVNYVRYWAGGVRRAEAVPNQFRGQPLAEAATIKRAPRAPSAAGNADEPSAVTLSVTHVQGRPGETISVPVKARITGASPVRSVLLRFSVQSLDGAAPLTAAPSIAPSPAIGVPNYGGANGGVIAGVWYDLPDGLLGEVDLGAVQIPIPANATPDSLFAVHIEKATFSPNGFVEFPVTTVDGFVVMNGRAAAPWNDEIPDAWRVQYFGSLLNILSHPDADADGDGLSNLAEFRTGTNPVDINSRFALAAESGSLSASALILRWPSVAGRSYRLESSSSLQGEWSLVQDSIPGTGGIIEFTPPADDSAARFYRVRLAP